MKYKKEEQYKMRKYTKHIDFNKLYSSYIKNSFKVFKHEKNPNDRSHF